MLNIQNFLFLTVIFVLLFIGFLGFILEPTVNDENTKRDKYRQEFKEACLKVGGHPVLGYYNQHSVCIK
jgi:hypothetical protein